MQALLNVEQWGKWWLEGGMKQQACKAFRLYFWKLFKGLHLISYWYKWDLKVNTFHSSHRCSVSGNLSDTKKAICLFYTCLLLGNLEGPLSIWPTICPQQHDRGSFSGSDPEHLEKELKKTTQLIKTQTVLRKDSVLNVANYLTYQCQVSARYYRYTQTRNWQFPTLSLREAKREIAYIEDY